MAKTVVVPMGRLMLDESGISRTGSAQHPRASFFVLRSLRFNLLESNPINRRSRNSNKTLSKHSIFDEDGDSHRENRGCTDVCYP